MSTKQIKVVSAEVLPTRNKKTGRFQVGREVVIEIEGTRYHGIYLVVLHKNGEQYYRLYLGKGCSKTPKWKEIRQEVLEAINKYTLANSPDKSRMSPGHWRKPL